MNRLGIFAFFDNEGIVDRYVDYYLYSLKQHVSRLVVIVCGETTNNSRIILDKYSSEVIFANNDDYTIPAYGIGLEYIGWDQLSVYDEILLTNDSVFGPITPLADVFEVMSQKNVDYWGISACGAYHVDKQVDLNEWFYIPAHVQEYFVVFRQPFVAKPFFRDAWKSSFEPIIYNDHLERVHIDYRWVRITEKFTEKEAIWDSFADTSQLDNEQPNAMLYCPEMMLSEYNVPFLLNKVFNMTTLRETCGEQVSAAFNLIKNQTNYDVDMIQEKVIRCNHAYDFVRLLALTYVLPVNFRPVNYSFPSNELKVALIQHLYYPEMFEEMIGYASVAPAFVDLYFTTDSNIKADLINKIASNKKMDVNVRVGQNRGRGESALIVGMADIVTKYDLVCFLKEKTSSYYGYITSKSWAEKIRHSLISTTQYIENVIDLFVKNQQLGLLCPTPPNHADYIECIGNEWTTNYENVVALAKKLNLNVPISEDKPPVAPLGGAFWFRPVAMKKLFEYGFNYEDFPAEPLAADGTLAHSIERIYPYVVQDAGYYPAYVMTDHYASLEYTNHNYYLREYNRTIRKYWPRSFDYRAMTVHLDIILGAYNYYSQETLFGHFLRVLRPKIPKSIYRLLRKVKLKRKPFK